MINNFSTKCDKGYFYINRFISLFIFIIFYAILSFLYYINIKFLLHFLFLFFTTAFIAVPGGLSLIHIYTITSDKCRKSEKRSAAGGGYAGEGTAAERGSKAGTACCDRTNKRRNPSGGRGEKTAGRKGSKMCIRDSSMTEGTATAKGITYACTKLPPYMQQILNQGGLIASLNKEEA